MVPRENKEILKGHRKKEKRKKIILRENNTDLLLKM
jgi:hypothetical protein